jgi:Kef-type K+ transport system membrane component KefB
MQVVLRNFVAAFVCFAFAVAVDFIGIKRPPVEVEFLILLPLSALLYVLVPFALWFANRHLFRDRPNGELLRVLLALVLSVAFAAAAFLPYLRVHLALGGGM